MLTVKQGGHVAQWIIKKVDSLSGTTVGTLPGHMAESEVREVLRRLACRHLSEAEIIASSLRRRAKGRATLLDIIGSGAPISVGESPDHYIADWKE
jgi:hypothetical protein